jgi:hypothetical protein
MSISMEHQIAKHWMLALIEFTTVALQTGAVSFTHFNKSPVYVHFREI